MGVGYRQLYIHTGRHKISKGVCLFFGGADYEGLPDTYTFVGGTLKDGDGDEIATREIVQKGVKDKKQEQEHGMIDLSTIPDHESEMYIGTGVKPEWLIEDLV